MNKTTQYKIVMWHKVKELSDQRLNKTQIGVKLGICRDTVRSYLKMTSDEFITSSICNKQYKKKLDPYKDFIKKMLEDTNCLSAPQVHDRLKEHYSDFPRIADRTVYNFVMGIRNEYDIPQKIEDLPRQTSQIPSSPYGKDAQVDFGEKLIRNEHGHYVRIYFFAIVFCRSRYKFIYLQNRPFTTATTVYAHSLAFLYFGGMPQRIIYDQDKVLLKSENLGDLLMTDGFRTFTQQCGFEVTFCRKADPQSKGKVENVVKYVKYNFLRGRVYRGIETLNEEAIGWLERTGNGKKHATTRLVPSEEFFIESRHLLSYHGKVEKPEDKMRPYTVRKDNTIAYRGCFYSLPLGSYKGSGYKVLVEIKDQLIQIYDEPSGKQIASHTISQIKGQLVQNSDHRRDKSNSIKDLEWKCSSLFDNDSNAVLYLELLQRDKPRYYRDNLQTILKYMPEYTLQVRQQALKKCLDSQVYHAGMMKEIAGTLVKKGNTELLINIDVSSLQSMNSYDMEPSKSEISVYNRMML